jgi:hypothetical protein
LNAIITDYFHIFDVYIVSKMVKAEINSDPTEYRFYTADVQKLKRAISSTGKFDTEIATAGKLSKEVLTKAKKGGRVARAKADGICNGLNIHGCTPKATRDDLFPTGEN